MVSGFINWLGRCTLLVAAELGNGVGEETAPYQIQRRRIELGIKPVDIHDAYIRYGSNAKVMDVFDQSLPSGIW